MAVLNSTINVTPLWEGVGLCEKFYGEFRSRRDCSRAIRFLDKGPLEVPYTVNRARDRRNLPLDFRSGSCMIQIEAAGPDLPDVIGIVPDRMVSMAEWVLRTCVRGSGHTGGFITSDVTTLENYVSTPGIDLDQPFPRSTAFFTVTMTTLVPDWISPGNFDPEMAYLLSKAAMDAEKVFSRPDFKRELVQRSRRLFNQARRMEPRGFRIPWWNQPPMLNNPNRTSTLTLASNSSNGAEAVKED